MGKTIVAIMYDFDRTLCTKDMQEYGFIPAVGMQPREFWAEVSSLTDAQEMDNILAYMYLMVRKGTEKRIRISRESFQKLGADVEFFQGIPNWFDRINAYGASIGVQVEHYIVSSGIKEIIEGTSIARCFKEIYACEFMYDENGVIVWPKLAVNYTAKTQFLFRINKGILRVDSSSAHALNEYTPEEERRVPFGNMIYIGDGLTDVPCMKLVRANGGQSIAVYDPQVGKGAADALLRAQRVNYVVPADYRANSRIEIIVKAVMRKIQAAAEMQALMKET